MFYKNLNKRRKTALLSGRCSRAGSELSTYLLCPRQALRCPVLTFLTVMLPGACHQSQILITSLQLNRNVGLVSRSLCYRLRCSLLFETNEISSFLFSQTWNSMRLHYLNLSCYFGPYKSLCNNIFSVALSSFPLKTISAEWQHQPWLEGPTE